MYLKRLWEGKSDWMKSLPEEEAMISVFAGMVVRCGRSSELRNWGIPAVWS